MANINPSENFLNTLHLTGDPNAAADAFLSSEKAAEIESNLNNLYGPKDAPKFTNGMSNSEKLKAFFNTAKEEAGKIMKAGAGKAGNMAKGVGKVLSSPAARVAGRVAGKVITPIAIATTLYDLGRLGEAGYRNIMANKKAQDTMDTIDLYNFMVENGADPLGTWQTLNGIDPDADIPKKNGQPVNTEENIDKALAELDDLERQKAQSDADLARAQELHDKAKMSYEDKLKAMQAQQAMTANGSGNNNGTPPPTVPPSTPPADAMPPANNPESPMPSVSTPTRFDYTNLDGLGNYGLNALTPQGIEAVAREQEAQALENFINPQGSISPSDILQNINQQYGDYRNAAQNDFRYGGQAIDPTIGQYNIDPRALRMAQNADNFATMFGGQGGRVKALYDNARLAYNARMGNELGMPYEQYSDAMLDRQREDLKARAQQINDTLETYKQQATTSNERLKYLQEQAKLQQAYELKLREIEAQKEMNRATNQANIEREQWQQAGNIATNNANLGYRNTGATAQLLEALALAPNVNVQRLFLSSPEVQMTLFHRVLDMSNPNDKAVYNEAIKMLQGFNAQGGSNELTPQQKMGLLQRAASVIRNIGE